MEATVVKVAAEVKAIEEKMGNIAKDVQVVVDEIKVEKVVENMEKIAKEIQELKVEIQKSWFSWCSCCYGVQAEMVEIIPAPEPVAAKETPAENTNPKSE